MAGARRHDRARREFLLRPRHTRPVGRQPQRGQHDNRAAPDPLHRVRGQMVRRQSRHACKGARMGALGEDTGLLGSEVLQLLQSRGAGRGARRSEEAADGDCRPSGADRRCRSERPHGRGIGPRRRDAFLRPFRKPAEGRAALLSRELQLLRRAVALCVGGAARSAGSRAGQREMERIYRFSRRQRSNPQPHVQHLFRQPRRDGRENA